MTRIKINHPFLVPEGFFDRQEQELLKKMDVADLQKGKKTLVWEVLKYAAIIITAIFLGRESVRIFPGSSTSAATRETVSVDMILSQVSDEEINNYLIDNITEEVFEKIKTK
jgi:hypothetical protein